MLNKELTDLGLSGKEASVYMAAIQLGPSPVQKISTKAKVNRATTYVIIEGLMEMGLMSTYDEGKKTFYVAEKPERLVDYFKSKESEIHKKVEDLKGVLPELTSLYEDFSDRPKVKYYEGVEGLKAVQNDFVDSLREEDIIYTFLPYDEFENSVLKKRLSNIRKMRLSKKIGGRVIYTSKEGRQAEYEREEKRYDKENLYIEHEKYPFEGGMNIYGNKIFMIDYKGKLGGVVIENKTLAKTIKVMFDVIWDSNENKIN